jgi:hypothetical protein
MKKLHEPHSPAWHKSRAYGYLTTFVMLLIPLFVGLIPAVPLFLKLFVPYPALEDADHWQGTVHVQGKFEVGPKGSIKLPRYFIDTPQGRKEFNCGLLGHRYECNSQHRLDGAKGEVWYHPLFGSLQERYVLASGPDAGRSIDVPYSALKEVNEERFDHGRYLWYLAFSLIPLAGATFCWRRYRKHSIAARTPATDTAAV